MSADDPSDRPSDDDLPPDPFPGDPFATSGENAPKPPGDAQQGFQQNIADLLGSMGGLGGAMGPIFQQFAAMQGQGGGLNWDVARQIALWTASGQHVESPPDPVERIKMEEIIRSAEKEVAAVSGLAVANGRVNAVVTTRAGWAAQALEDHRALLNRLATSLASTAPNDDDAATDDAQDPMVAMLSMMSPMLVSTQAGALIGELATQSLGSYDIPVPRSGPKEQLVFVLRNIDEFATEWSIPLESARTHVAIVETATHAVLRLSHVHSKLYALIEKFVGSYVVDPDAIGEQLRDQLGSLGSFDSSAFPETGDEPSLFGTSETPAQSAIRREISRILTPVLGFVDYVAAVSGARMMGDNRKVVEAWRRRRISPAKGKSSAGQILGLTVDDNLLDRGASFIGGVLQRKGPDALAVLWSEIDHLPTENELAAPGLWLARVGLSD